MSLGVTNRKSRVQLRHVPQRTRKARKVQPNKRCKHESLSLHSPLLNVSGRACGCCL